MNPFFNKQDTSEI